MRATSLELEPDGHSAHASGTGVSTPQQYGLGRHAADAGDNRLMEAIPEVQPDLAFQVSHGGHPTSATRIDVPVSCRARMSPCPATLPP